MRKIGLAVMAGAVSLACCTAAYADDAKIYYKDGTRLEFDDFDIKFNVQLQPRYSYVDFDSENRGGGVEDVSNFSVRRARWVVSGNALADDQFSYKLQYDFASDSGGGDLKDAWIQWNGDPADVRFGRQKVAFTRQERISSSKLYFVERSEILDPFTAGRDFGVSAMSALGPVNVAAGLYNGDSDEADNKHNFAVSVDYACENYGKRGLEGDMREDGTLGMTAGASLLYGEGSVSSVDFDQIRLNADAGLRVAGFDVQAEYFWSEVDFDGTTGSTPQNNGFYVQGTYTMNQLGFGGRFGLFDPESGTGIDEITEYALVVNYFLNGHYLKLQNQITFLDIEPDGPGESVTDLRYDLQLAGYF